MPRMRAPWVSMRSPQVASHSVQVRCTIPMAGWHRDTDRFVTTTLYITNGDSVTGTMREAGVTAELLAWRDVLHDEPVPGGLALAELSRVRGEFLVDRGWADPATVHADLAAR